MANREFNNVNINVEFNETANRQQLSSGESINTLFGKIKKWLVDLKPVAFTGSYNDLDDKPDITNNIAYSVATSSSDGLMSASDKGKLDDITLSADSVSFNSTTTSGNAIGTLTINETSTTLYAPKITSDCTHLRNIKFGGSSILPSANNYYGIAMGTSTYITGQNNFVFGSCLNYGLSSATTHKQFIIGQLNAPISSGNTYTVLTSLTTLGDATAFVIGNGYYSTIDGAIKRNAFRINYNGSTYGKEFLSSGADYAESLEWKDQNINNEDRVGYFVTLDENYIKLANAGEYIVGAVSGIPSVIGNEADSWQGRFIKDDFGRIIYTEWEEIDDETQEVVTKKAPVINSAYDPTLSYRNRSERQEWDNVGMLGIIRVYDDGTCEPNSYCKVADGGIATAATVDEHGYLTPVFRVMRRISDNVIEIFFK